MADLVIGAALVLILAAAASAVGLVIDGAQSSREAARSAAVELARGAEPVPALQRAGHLAPDDAVIRYETDDGAVRVWVETDIDLPHPIFLTTSVALRSEAEVPIAPYRSGR